MTMVSAVGCSSLKEYVLGKEIEIERPEECLSPGCWYVGLFWKNGGYWRRAQEAGLCAKVWIQRFMCPGCKKGLSMLLEFLVPYRFFTAPAVAKPVERYLTERKSYRCIAGENAVLGNNDDPPEPSHTQIFRWVARVVDNVVERVGTRLSRACVREGKDDQLEGLGQCWNARKAHSIKKVRGLVAAARARGMAAILFDTWEEVLLKMRAHFLRDVQGSLEIFSGRHPQLSGPQTMQHLLC